MGFESPVFADKKEQECWTWRLDQHNASTERLICLMLFVLSRIEGA